MKSLSLFYLYSFLASLVVGFHIFSFKYIDVLMKNKERKSKNRHLFEISATIFVSIVAFLVSRVLIFKGMQNTDQPALVHIILNTSVFITLLLSVLLLKSTMCISRLILGIFVTLCGLYIVQTSIIEKV